MNWHKSINEAIDYIEENLTREIDYRVVAQIASCSECEFRRIFSQIAQISLSGYIRRRRLTLAVTDIKNGDKIIDVAMRYGYDSQAAFSRAFKRLCGLSPSSVKNNDMIANLFPRLTFKLVLMEGTDMSKRIGYRTNIIGAGEVDCAISAEADEVIVHKTNINFWDTKGNEVLVATALPFYGAFTSEKNCRLFGDISHKKVLEIGCGTGQSLQYLWEQSASELWGVDISAQQIKKADQYLKSKNIPATLICSPMEIECGIPKDHFDCVYSVYAIGWTTNLEETFLKVHSYLKKDGVFIFSWSHPIHKCVASENDMLTFRKCYFDESWYSVSLGGEKLSLCDRKMSTYINALAKAGFIIEEMVEQSDDELIQDNNNDFAKKAKMLPVTFVIKAKKL